MLAIPFLLSTVSSVATVIYDMMLRRSSSPDPRPLYNITSFSGGEDSWAQWAEGKEGDGYHRGKKLARPPPC